MQKGFGLYAPHETTIFLLKSLLLSFWIGIDLIAALVASTLPTGVLVRHGLLLTIALAILIFGTVFSALFVWATGSLFAKDPSDLKNSSMALLLRALKQERNRLIGCGIAGSTLMLLVMCAGLLVLQNGIDEEKRTGHASAEISQKCSEIAALEQRLFQSDEQVVLAECLIQYDEKYASLRNQTEKKQ
ncbi:MAG: hypothetical protein ACXWIN_04680 [Burkholderiaceae bacterium]